MKNVLIVVLLLFLSCKNKENSNENKIASKSVSEVVEVVKNNNLEVNLEHENTLVSNNINYPRKVLYKGTLNDNIKIWLYLNEQEHPCGGNLTILNAMYKYDEQDKWILLNVTTDKQKMNYCMVEDNFTGALFLEEKENALNGYWISTNTKKQFKVKLEKLKSDNTPTIEKLDEILFDDLLYNKNDC